jgi:hypothetical protein
MEEEYKYKCEKCKFYTNAKSAFNNHMITEKHMMGIKAKRCDKKYPEKCPECDYKPVDNKSYIQHTLNFHSSKTARKEKFKYFCEKCDFGTFSEILFNKHKTTKKHSRYDKLEEVSDNI